MGLTRFLVPVLAAVLVAIAGATFAQVMSPQDPMTSLAAETELFGGGWGQLSDLPELIAFAQDTGLTLLLTALIVLHPVRRKLRRTLEDLIIPRLFFLYALIGMAVGFLVIQHGYIIGFVIFGIGALLRFRSTLDNAADTVEVILVTVIGLSVGLGLPVMAILLGIVGWVLIWVAGRKRGYEITLHAADAAHIEIASAALTALISGRNWSCISTRQIPAKHSCQFVIVAPGALHSDDLEHEIAESLPEGTECKIRF
jgi:hypothetical protein